MHNKKPYQLPSNPREFLQSLLDKSPKDLPSIKKVAGIGRIIYSAKPNMTAAVANTKPYSLIFGRQFIEKNIENDEEAIFLLFHELTHLVLDHFAKDVLQLFEEKGLGGKNVETIFAQQCTHIVVDAQVNATCYHTLKEDKYMGFPIRYYSFENRLKAHEELSQKILAEGGTPPPAPTDNMPYCFLHPEGEAECPDHLKHVHRKLYSEQGIANSELIDALKDWFKENEDQLPKVVKRLLGNHKSVLSEDRSSGSLTEEDKEILEGISQAIAEESKNKLDKEYQEAKRGNKSDKELDAEMAPSKELGGHSDKDEDSEKETEQKSYSYESNPVRLAIEKYRNNLRVNKEITKLFKKNYKPSPAGKLSRAIEGFFPKYPRRTVVPNFHDRRTAALYSRGILPVFHTNPNKGVKHTVACYIDVSGSQEHVVPKVISAVLRYKKLIGNYVYCFSTEVVDVHVKKLASEVLSYGGTDFNSVAEHILKHKFKSVIILTDGVSSLSQENIDMLKKRNVNIVVGWTEANIEKEPLAPVTKSDFWLFDE